MSESAANLQSPAPRPEGWRDSAAGKLHAARQPLNRMALTIENIRLRIVPTLDNQHSDYLESKLERLDQQIHELHCMIEVMSQD